MNVYHIRRDCMIRGIAAISLFLGCGAFSTQFEAQAQQNIRTSRYEVKGQVTDSTGEPLVGATVIVVGTNTGTATDIDGNFQISVNGPATIRVTYVGYTSKEVNVTKPATLDIKLEEDRNILEEVVVVGYGTARKIDLTGAVTRADMTSLKHSPNSNVLQALQGTVPGLNLGMSTSAGGSPSMSIRGTNTLGGNKDVLIVLDGMIYNSSLSSINPDDIESIDILKDASSTAVYGAQAANGVLLITTKRGTLGKPRISLTASYTFSNPTHNYRPMNRSEYVDHVKALYYDQAFTGPDYLIPNPDFDVVSKIPDQPARDGYNAGNDYDWWGEGTQTGHMWETKVSLSGGSDVSDYFISYSYTDQAGFIKNDDFKRNSVRMNLNTHIAPWWKVGVQAFGSFVNQDGAEPDLGLLIHTNPLVTPYDANGNVVPYPLQTLDSNPLMGYAFDDYERHNYFSGIVSSEIKFPLKGLAYRINFGNNYRIDKTYRANEYGYNLQGEAYKNFTDYYDWNLDNILYYNNEFGEHNIDATLLYGASKRKESGFQAKAQGFTRLTLGYESLEQGTNQYTYSSAWQETLNYQMARLSYRFKNRYLITGTVRRDGFSGFASNRKWATFPSVSVGWIVSDEPFFHIPAINYLKLRAGYGVSGNMTTRYKSQSQISSDIKYIFGDGGTPVIGQEVSKLGNDDLKWEKSKGFNFGLDYSLINQRLFGSIEYYMTTTHDLLYDMVIPTTTGFSVISSNVGEIRNRGFELSLTSKNVDTRNFCWNSTLTFSTNSNKIMRLTGEDNDHDGKEDDNVSSNLFIGHSIGTVYGYKIDGIYQLDDEIPEGFHPGNYKIVDTNDDGKITPDDRIILGKSEPTCRISLMNNLSYRNFHLSFLLNSVIGGKGSYLGSNSSSMIRDDNNLRWNHPAAVDYWSPSNPDGIYARSISSPKITPTRYENRTFLRLQDLNFSYTLPKPLLTRCNLSNLELFFSAKNLFTITGWHGNDPEANSTYWGRPVMRSFSFGVNVTY